MESKTKLLDQMRLVRRLKHMRWMGPGAPPNAIALLCQEAMDSPHLRGELLWVIRRRFLYRSEECVDCILNRRLFLQRLAVLLRHWDERLDGHDSLFRNPKPSPSNGGAIASNVAQ